MVRIKQITDDQSAASSALCEDKNSGTADQKTSSSNGGSTGKTCTEDPVASGENKCGSEFNMDEEFKKLFQKYKKLGLTEKDFAKSKVLKNINYYGSYKPKVLKWCTVIVIVVAVLFFGLHINCFFSWPISNETLIRAWFGWYNVSAENEECVLFMPEIVQDIFRPPVECDFCRGVKSVDIVYNISQDEFEEKYAYSGVPVVIGDGTTNWTAPKYFSFDFFKDLYLKGSNKIILSQEKACQFFPYKTEFLALSYVLSMSPERARMEGDSEPWYVGWSNCDFTAANILRKHYEKPYFLPRLSESSKTDWIFMGSPGYGAHLHIDNVDKPSWQAQITGTKRWTLEPPPECYYVCEDQLQVTVKPGQIIVIDTNIWYHSTLNVGDDISITIGSEYD